MKIISDGIGDAPIEEAHFDNMQALAGAVDDILNPNLQAGVRHTGFVLMVFPFQSHEGRCNYISNAHWDDVVKLLEEQLARFKGEL